MKLGFRLIYIGLLVFGCSDNSPDAGSSISVDMGGIPNGDAGTAETCSEASPCPIGQICVGDQCELACAENGLCPQGFQCRDGVYCEPVQSCGSDTDCAGGVCNCEGICQSSPTEPCMTDLQCAVADFCDTCWGGCRARASQCEPCRSDAECETNARCRTSNGMPVAMVAGNQTGGVCLRVCQGSCDVLGPGFICTETDGGDRVCAPESGDCGSQNLCQQDAECAPTEFCNERQRCQAGCTTDTECAVGTICHGVRCLPPCDNVENPCEAPLLCTAEGRCKRENGCTSSVECGEPETYCDRAQGLCVSGCEVDDDCQDATKLCLAGSCQTRGCSGNFQCGFGQICDIANGRCQDAPGRHCEANCDPQDEQSCGASAICVSVQDADGNELGDFCFEGCLGAPNECPQGYQCQEFEMQGQMMSTGGAESYCARDCSYSPL